MKVLIISQYFWPESFRINELVNSLYGLDCDITVLTGQPNYPEGSIQKGYKAYGINSHQYNGYTIFRVPLIPRGKSGGLRLFANYVSFMITASIFGPWMLRKRQFDTILVYAPSPILQVIPAIIIKKIKKIPLTTWIGDLWPQSLESSGFIKNRFILKIVEYVVRFIYSKNDLLLAQSRSFIEPVKALSGSVPVEYFPNPGESIFSDETKEKDSGLILKPGFNVVFAGNLGGVQALDTVLDAAEHLKNHPDIWFTIIGSGSRGHWLADAIASRNLLNVSMAGRFSPDCMPHIYKQADALLVSLVNLDIYKITVPAKVQSYMAAGRPIICGLLGEGARIVTEAGAGIVIPPEDAEALCNAVLKLKNMPPKELAGFGLAGREYYESNFNSDTLSRLLIARLTELNQSIKKPARSF